MQKTFSTKSATSIVPRVYGRFLYSTKWLSGTPRPPKVRKEKKKVVSRVGNWFLAPAGEGGGLLRVR